jgi:hypothetical protein
MQPEIDPDAAVIGACSLRNFYRAIDIPVALAVLIEGTGGNLDPWNEKVAEVQRLVFCATKLECFAIERNMSSIKWNPAQRFPASPAQPRLLVRPTRIGVRMAYPLDGMGV